MDSFNEIRNVLQEVLQLGDRARRMERGTQLLGGIPEFDSAAVVSVVMAVEDRFGLVVEDEEITAETFQTVGTLTDFVDRKLAAG